MIEDRIPENIHVELLSDTTFARGEGTAGLVDTEVEHDEYGIPFIGGKTIRGLMRDSWLSMYHYFPKLKKSAERVLGRSRNLDIDCDCKLRFGDAILSEPIRQTIRLASERSESPLSRSIILSAFTTIRYQTAEDRKTGTPATTTLRSSRVVLSGFSFDSSMIWIDAYKPSPEDLKLLALCALATRHGGLLRNRGRGHIRLSLDGDLEKTRNYAKFELTENV